ncbi:MAG: response regulator [Desulfomonilaceae bacterium]
MSYRIVVADKDSRSQEAVTRFLGVAENEFVGVSTSGELKSAIKNRKPDLIILNSILQDVPGWRLVRRIKESRDYNDVPVLLMTGDPEGPTQAEAKTAGADGYLSKPIQGQTLKTAVQSLLGIEDRPATVDEDELTIEFEDDSGEMTEELLALSNAEVNLDESPTDVGDTVEIDTGTLIAELEPSTDAISAESYGDTVKLNLDDMQLETEVEDGTSFEPTIELVSDLPMEIESPGAIAIESAAIEEPPLPDFSTVTRDQRSDRTAKDSVTIDLSMMESSMQAESDFSFAPSSTKKTDTSDHGYTDIEKILEVQDPTRVLTSEDLLLHDDSLVKGALSETELEQIDIIDLEEDSAIKEMEAEELEAIDAEDEPSLGLDLEETVPVASIDMEEIANEDLSGMIDLEYEEESSLEIDLESGQAFAEAKGQAPEELTLEEVPYEDITTQEFFGEELPTEEFPAEKFPEEKTGTINLDRELAFDKVAAASDGAELHELTLDTGAGDEVLFGDEEEPALEVTEDISLEEITLEDGPADKSSKSIFEIPSPPEPVSQFFEAVPSAVGDRQQAKTAPISDGVHVSEASGVRPSISDVKPSIAESKPPENDERKASVSDIAGIVSSILNEKLKEPLAGKIGLAEAAPPAVMPDQRQYSEDYQKLVKASLPSKEELMEGITLGISRSFPTREEIFQRVDLIINGHLPSDQAIAERMDAAIKASLPSSADLTERIEKAVSSLHSPELMTKGFEEAFGKFLPISNIAERVDSVLKSIPADEEISRRFDQAIGVLPSPETILNIVDKAVRGIASPEELSNRLSEALAPLLSPETLSARFEKALQTVPYQQVVKQSIDEALGKAISSEMVVERLDQALRGIPSQEYIRLRLDHAFTALPTPDSINQRIDVALQAFPSKDELRARLDKSFEGIPSTQVVMERVDRALDAIPSRSEVVEKLEQSLQCMPSSEAVVSLLNRRLETSIPSKDELGAEMRAILEKRIQSAITEAQIQEAVNRLLPDTEEILKLVRDILPGRERFQETIASSIAEAVQNNLPERVWVERISRSLFDERTRGLLPHRDEVITLIREEIQSKVLDMVERIIRQEIERITSTPIEK